MLWPPCSAMALSSAAALAAPRVVSTTKNPSFANFWAMAPPTPQRIPTGISLSSSTLPCASLVLRPSACHLEVAPTTTATGPRAELMRDSSLIGDDCSRLVSAVRSDPVLRSQSQDTCEVLRIVGDERQPKRQSMRRDEG